MFTWDEIRKHTTVDSCWLVVKGRVYDVTHFLTLHPAGEKSILKNSGKDATEHFNFHSKKAHALWKNYEIGVLEGYNHSPCNIL